MLNHLRHALIYRALIYLGGISLTCVSYPAPASVIYEFDGTVTTGFIDTPMSFTFTSPDFLTSPTFVPFSALDTCKWELIFQQDCYGVNFDPDFDWPEGNEMIWYDLSAGGGPGFLFPNGSFTTPGTFQSIAGGVAVLKVTETSAVPEPATWTMVLLGFGALGFTARRCRKGALRQAA